MEFNASQKKAIEAEGNVIVSAGAGSGKTRVLVERCLDRVLKNEVSMENILMITFMKDAATEMRTRIRDRLCEEIDKAVKNRNRKEENRLELELTYLDDGHISTIHGFCVRLIREHFDIFRDYVDKPGINVRSLDDATTFRLKRNAFRIVIREYYKHDKTNEDETIDRSNPVTYLRHYLENNVEALQNIIFTIYDYAQSQPDPEAWIKSQVERAESETPDHWLDRFFGSNEHSGELLEKLKNILLNEESYKRNAPQGLLEEIKAHFHKLHVDPTRENQIKFLNAIDSLSEDFGKVFKSDPCKELKNYLSFFNNIKEDWDNTRWIITLLFQFTQRFEKEFRRQKHFYKGITFTDQLQFASKVLENEEIRKSIQDRYKMIFVDEFQDIDPIQDSIIKRIEQGNRFLVGDVKQSIYRFRFAAPEIFRGYEETASEEMEGWKLCRLNENYRSQPDIIHFINDLFLEIMHGDVDFDEYSKLIPQKKKKESKGPRIQLLYNCKIKQSGQEQDTDDGQYDGGNTDTLELTTVEKEAIMVADQLLKMKQELTVGDDGQPRERKWSEFVLLCRSGISNIAPVFIREFERRGIPINAPGISLFECVEIVDLLNLLTLLDNPRQDIPLAGLLCSPFIDLDLNELVELRQSLGEAPLSESFFKLLDHPDPNLSEGIRKKIEHFLKEFFHWRERLRLLPASQLLEEILLNSRYEDIIMGQPLADQKIKNLRRLLVMAEDFDPLRRQSARRFLDYTRVFQECEKNEITSANSCDGADAVQIRTIHKSKGLEFPVVFLINTNKDFFKNSNKIPISIDRKMGIICPSCSQKDGYPVKTENMGSWVYKQIEERETRWEELRMLYVALTRAEEHLIITGSFDIKMKDGKFEPLKFLSTTPADARSYMGWILPWVNSKCKCDAVPCFEAFAQDFYDIANGAKDKTASEKNVFKTRSDPSVEFAVGLHSYMDKAAPELTDEDDESHKEPVSREDIERAMSIKNWRYPYRQVVDIPSKNSITGLKLEANLRKQRQNYSKKKFIKKTVAKPPVDEDPIRRGIAYHAVLEHLQMKPEYADEPPGSDFYNGMIQYLTETGLLTEEVASSISAEEISRFWQTDLAKDILRKWEYVQREVSFSIRLTAEQFTSMGIESGIEGTDETLVIQGVIDLMMIDENEIWLLDYKSDQITGENIQSKIKSYLPQVRLYTYALESIYKLPVTRCYIVFMRDTNLFDVKNGMLISRDGKAKINLA
ncbi:MAG: UvrD-helicase domain-containing protein [Verrucomicrobia bacterium]|nr:UvrD-helicase domain-containing protein [Verrucomicrobiota bacterium]